MVHRDEVLVTVRSFGRGSTDWKARLGEHGLTLVHGDVQHELAELAPHLERAVAWIAGGGPVSAEHLAAAPNLRIIARYGVGVDAVDLGAAKRVGVRVTNTPGANAAAVADLTIALILAGCRHVVAADRMMRSGEWPLLVSRELSSVSVGVVGLGQIGRAVAHRLRHGFGARVLAHDVALSDEQVDLLGCEPFIFSSARLGTLASYSYGTASPPDLRSGMIRTVDTLTARERA